MAPYYGADHDLDSKMCQKTAKKGETNTMKLLIITDRINS